jgi:hypothetical protein
MHNSVFGVVYDVKKYTLSRLCQTWTIMFSRKRKIKKAKVVYYELNNAPEKADP